MTPTALTPAQIAALPEHVRAALAWTTNDPSFMRLFTATFVLDAHDHAEDLSYHMQSARVLATYILTGQ